MLVQHLFSKFFGCWFCAAVLAEAQRTAQPRGETWTGHTRRRFHRGILTPTHEGIDNMAQRVEHHPLEAAFAALLNNGLDGTGEALRILVNEASRIERNHFLNAQPHERTAERTDYANGFKPKTMMTSVGELTFDRSPSARRRLLSQRPV